MFSHENVGDASRVWLTVLCVYVGSTLIIFAVVVCYPWLRLFACCARVGVRYSARTLWCVHRCCTRSANRIVRYTSVAFSEQSRQPFIAEASEY